MREVRDRQVVCNRRERSVELMPRGAQARKLGGAAAGYFLHHPVMNPAARRTGEV